MNNLMSTGPFNRADDGTEMVFDRRMSNGDDLRISLSLAHRPSSFPRMTQCCSSSSIRHPIAACALPVMNASPLTVRLPLTTRMTPLDHTHFRDDPGQSSGFQ